MAVSLEGTIDEGEGAIIGPPNPFSSRNPMGKPMHERKRKMKGVSSVMEEQVQVAIGLSIMAE